MTLAVCFVGMGMTVLLVVCVFIWVGLVVLIGKLAVCRLLAV